MTKQESQFLHYLNERIQAMSADLSKLQAAQTSLAGVVTIVVSVLQNLSAQVASLQSGTTVNQSDLDAIASGLNSSISTLSSAASAAVPSAPAPTATPAS